MHQISGSLLGTRSPFCPWHLLPGRHFCASILTIQPESRPVLMNLLVTTYTSSTLLSTSLSSLPRTLLVAVCLAPLSVSEEPLSPGSQGPPVPRSPQISPVWCSSPGAACADWGRGGTGAPHIVCPPDCHCARLNTPRHWLSEPPEGAARGGYQSSQGWISRLPGVDIKDARNGYHSCQGLISKLPGGGYQSCQG